MAKRVKKSVDMRKAEYMLNNLKLRLTDKIEPVGYTLEYKTVKMAKKNYKFIEVFFNGESLGTVDPYTILYFCNTSTFISLHAYGLRNRIGDILNIKAPEGEMYVTETLLKVLAKIRYFNVYEAYNRPYDYENLEISSSVIELMEDASDVE